MKYLFILFPLFSISCNETKTTKNNYTSINKTDLNKAQWITGNWKSTYEGKPFFEYYDLINDSTLKILSYEWDGKDTSKTSLSFLSFKNGAYFLGDSMNWKATAINDREIKMIPVYKANNEIHWKFISLNKWEAILKGASKTNTYVMERIPLIDSLMK